MSDAHHRINRRLVYYSGYVGMVEWGVFSLVGRFAGCVDWSVGWMGPLSAPVTPTILAAKDSWPRINLA